MLALQKHAGEFTKESGITVNFTVKPENDMRNQAAQEFANQSGQFDVATLSNFEIPFYSKNNWLWSLDDIQAYKDDKEFNQADIFPSMTEVAEGPGRQALRRAVLRRVVVPDVPQGYRGQGGRDDQGQPDLGRGRRGGGQAGRRRIRDEGHLPARPAWLG